MARYHFWSFDARAEEQRSEDLMRFTGDRRAVNAVLNWTPSIYSFEVPGAVALVRRYATPAVPVGTEILAAIETAEGRVHLCSRYAWEMSEFEAAVFFRGSISRHQLVLA